MGLAIYFTYWCFFLNLFITTSYGLLYPKQSETREIFSLDGIWNFLLTNEKDKSVSDKWYSKDLSQSGPTIPMPVPASYNDITENSEIRDHVGAVWYDKKFFVPISWSQNQRVWIRFGSVHYEATVWINGEFVTKHAIGHLPFEAEITKFVKFGQENRITVLCDNELTSTTVPQGNIQRQSNDKGTVKIQTYTFDFFNYAGIHRSVIVYTTPKTYIEDVLIKTSVASTTGSISYEVKQKGNVDNSKLNVVIRIRDKQNVVVANATSGPELKGTIDIKNVKLWWPYLMNPEPGYLYDAEISLLDGKQIKDIYRLRIGVRTLKWNSTSFLINDKPIYFRGFGKHEDSDIRGKGLDFALLTKDFNLIKWIGANSYRTSHYPYSEESMAFADEHGIMVIDECPSGDTDIFSNELEANHKSSIEQLIRRDRNHPSVVMWSIANEPRTSKSGADKYFGEIVKYAKSLDASRPITAAIADGGDKAGKHLDIFSFNRYNAWYSNAGRLDMITKNVVNEATNWHKKYNKPIIMSEYGADTLEGLHLLPSYVWSEEYQAELLSQHFQAFDILRNQNFFIGEFVWNFADFKTGQSYTRVGGNKKGLFTRNRQPKSSAYVVRKRYFALANELQGLKLPKDLFLYIINNSKNIRDFNEL